MKGFIVSLLVGFSTVSVASGLSDLGKIYLYNEIGHHVNEVVRDMGDKVMTNIPQEVQYAPDLEEFHETMKTENHETTTYYNPFTGEVTKGQYLNQDPYAMPLKRD